MLNTAQTPATDAAPAIGTPVYNHTYSKIGFIAEIKETGGNVFAITGNGLQSEPLQVLIVWQDGGYSGVSLGIARPWINRAAEMDIAEILNAPEMLRIAKIDQANAYAERQAEQARIQRVAEEFRESIRAKIPTGSKAVLVAELVEDKSDSMSDYHGSTTTRQIVLGFSQHTRDLFPEMRKAAANHPETAFLTDAPEDAEHREKYSMGAGFYLKAGYRHSSGWKVSKLSLDPKDPARGVPMGEWAVPDATTPAASKSAAPAAVSAGAFTIEEHTHTKKGFQMWIAVASVRVEREAWEAQRDASDVLGGWWSRAWGKTPGGFAFRDADAARQFVEGQTGTPATDAPAATPSNAAPVAGMGDKLRDLADGMQSAIDDKFADRQENTPKRQRQAASARLDGYQMKRAQAGLRALAELHDSGNVPGELCKVKSKKAALDLAREKIEFLGGYYDAGRATGEPATATPESLAFWALLKPKSAAEVAADDARRQLAEIKRSTIPGYFPTPAEVAADLVRYTGLEDGQTVLEPSAGSGAILDAIKERAPGAKVTAYEINSRLCSYLQTVGHTVEQGDFTESTPGPELFDAVVMNPPFENGQDMAHVRHAFDFLKPGGHLAAIMSPGFTFRSDRKAQAFRDWLETVEHWKADLPAGTFKESGTGVATVAIYIQKPGA